MPRNGSGSFSLAAGNPVSSGTTIDPNWANNTLTDIKNELTNSVAADGQTPMTNPLKHNDGTISYPSITFNSESNTGIYRAGTNQIGMTVNGANALTVSANAVDIAGIGNSASLHIGMTPTAATFDVSKEGTGAYLPLTISTGGNPVCTFDVSGVTNVRRGLSVQSENGHTWGSFGTSHVAASYMSFKKGGTASIIGYLGTDGGGAVGGGVGDNLALRAENDLVLITGGSERLRIAMNGNATLAGTLSMGSAFSNRNYLHNGGAQVAQRPATALVNDALVYGQVDRFYIVASATTVISGQATQAVVAAAKTGKAISAAVVSTTGASAVSICQRIESRDSYRLSGTSVTVSGQYYQNTGAAIVPYVALVRPTVLDNWASSVEVARRTFTAVNGGWTKFSVTLGIPAGAADLGLCVIISTGVLSALSNASFYWADAQLEEGTSATPFEHRPYQQELALCQRYYQSFKCVLNAPFGQGNSYSANLGLVNIPLKVTMRTMSPTVVTLGAFKLMNGSWSNYTVSSITGNASNENNVLLNVNTVSSGLTAGQVCTLLADTGGGTLTFSTEL